MGQDKPDTTADDKLLNQTMASWWVIWKKSFEVGLLAQRQLIELGAIGPEQRLFFTREERRRLTRTNVS